MNILLTGATGYVGKRVMARLLSRGDQVTAVVRNLERAATLPARATPLVADLSQPEPLVDAAVRHDAVVHTAFPSHDADWFTGVEIERKLINAWAAALTNSGVILLVSNGTGFYGDARGRFLDETTVVPRDNPAAVRAVATLAATATLGLRGVELRLASFVHGDCGSVFLPPLMENARKTGRSIYIGDGGNRLSAVHVDAAADAYIAALHHGRDGEIYHIADDNAPTMRELAEAIAIGTHAKAESVTVEEASALLDPFTAMFLALDNGISSRKARCELDWSPAGHVSILWDVAHGSYADPVYGG